MKYIVTWFIIQFVSVSCPEPPAKYDEFGRRLNQSLGHNSMGCAKLDSVKNTKYFNNYDSAVSFAKRGDALLKRKELKTGAGTMEDVFGPWFSYFNVDTLKRPYTR